MGDDSTNDALQTLAEHLRTMSDLPPNVREAIRVADRLGTKSPPHPMQPVVLDHRGVARFKENAIVSYLLEAGRRTGVDLNTIATLPFRQEDRVQLVQLIGYTIQGAGELSYMDPKIIDDAEKSAAELRRTR